MRVLTYRRVTRNDRHGKGGGKILEERYCEVPDEVMYHVWAEDWLSRAKNDIAREAVKMAAKELWGIDIDHPRVEIPRGPYPGKKA